MALPLSVFRTDLLLLLPLLCYSFIFPLCGKTASYVTLQLVDLEDILDLSIQLRIFLSETLAYILVYGCIKRK